MDSIPPPGGVGEDRIPWQRPCADPVVQTKLYRPDSTVDVEQMSRSFRTVVVDLEGNELPRERPAARRTEGSSLRGWLWIAAAVILLIVILATR